MLKPVNFIVEDFEISPLQGEDLDRFDVLAEEVYAILSDEQTLHFIPEKRLNNKDEAMQRLKLSLLNFHSGRNYIHFIRSRFTGNIAGIINVLSPTLVQEYYHLNSYPYFVEFYIKGEHQGDSIMSKILPKVLHLINKQDIDVIAAVADRRNFAARKVLEKSGFTIKGQFDKTKDLFQIDASIMRDN